ncbi:MAG: hypothetical protein EAX81_00230 [Candidatus Thorarchaeota archaeon]|nr:hypothetical protein [Candidatus Thorarchaeota archaeon]
MYELANSRQVSQMPSLAGAVILPKHRKTLLFKNRDMINRNHKDELFYDVDCFGIRGVDNVTEKVGGLAIGVNNHGLAAANTHVRNMDDPSYYLLTEQILMFAKDAENGLGMVRDHLRSGRKYQWGNLVLADRDSILVIELAGDEHSVEWSERKALRTAHHIMLDTEGVLRSSHTRADEYSNSVKRVERGYDLIRKVSSVSDVFNILKDHGDNLGQSSLCKHAEAYGDHATTMSYVVEVDYSVDTARPRIVFHVAKGNPCQSAFASIPIVFPADEEIMKRAAQFYHGDE